MPMYRAYLLDADGKIVWGDWLEADDLKAAEIEAHKLCGKGVPTVELWQGSARVAEIPCAES